MPEIISTITIATALPKTIAVETTGIDANIITSFTKEDVGHGE